MSLLDIANQALAELQAAEKTKTRGSESSFHSSGIESNRWRQRCILDLSPTWQGISLVRLT